MSAIANALVALVAALHVYFLILEMFLWTKPLELRFRSSQAIVATSGANFGIKGALAIICF
jgi:putative membrane protein